MHNALTCTYAPTRYAPKIMRLHKHINLSTPLPINLIGGLAMSYRWWHPSTKSGRIIQIIVRGVFLLVVVTAVMLLSSIVPN